jgi:hypothetical protein
MSVLSSPSGLLNISITILKIVEYLTAKNTTYFSEFEDINTLPELLRRFICPAGTNLADRYLQAKCCQRQTNRYKDAS